MTEPAGAGQPFPRAFLSVAGATLARHQLGLALALDCQRLICMARGVSPELIALQHAAEDAGVQFAIITNSRQLAGLVTAADDVIVISEGLFAEPASVVPLIDGRTHAVLVQPVEGALAAGYERIDLNRASAGLMRIPGELTQKLQDLPPDFDLGAALMRIALQAGVEMREVPLEARAGSDWRLVRSEAEAVVLENEWLKMRLHEGFVSPGRALAKAGVIGFGSSLLHAGNASNAISAGVVAILALAAGLGWFGMVWVGLLFAAGAWVLGEAGRLLRSAERRVLGLVPPAIPRSDILLWLTDSVIAGLILVDEPHFAGETVISWLAAPIILLLLLSLIPRVLGGKAATWIGDRLVLGIVLAAASAAGQTLPVVQLASIGLIVAALTLRAQARE